MASPAEAARSPRVEQRRQRILAAAGQCFAKAGFARTRIEDVAEAAGVSRALVYNHFGSKEELARQVCSHLLEEWSAAVDEVLDGAASAGQALESWLRVNLADSRRPLLTAMLAEDAVPVLPDWEQAARGAMDEWHAKLVALLERGVAAGEFRADIDVDSTAEVLRAMQVGMMQHVISERPFVDVSNERHLRAAGALLVAGLRVDP
jgi:TetR/AcrR family transcriptional regulator, transcriptional repressor for nem operon